MDVLNGKRAVKSILMAQMLNFFFAYSSGFPHHQLDGIAWCKMQKREYNETHSDKDEDCLC